jgi:CopG family nickel-responsive transcriptional regulator
MVVVSLSIPDELLSELDAVLGKEWFASRSEVIRQAVRKYISEYKELELLRGDVIATITVLYDKVEQNIDQLQIQHEFGDVVTAYLHTHLTDNSCLEVMVIKGKSSRLKDLVDGIKANRHVRQLKFSVMAVD